MDSVTIKEASGLLKHLNCSEFLYWPKIFYSSRHMRFKFLKLFHYKPLVLLLNNMLCNRFFQVIMRQTESHIKILINGLPQGSVPSSILGNVEITLPTLRLLLTWSDHPTHCPGLHNNSIPQRVVFKLPHVAVEWIENFT